MSLAGGHVILCGDMREQLAKMPRRSVDAIVCDPPYGLSAPPDIAVVMKAWLAGEEYEHASAGFMGRDWDSFIPGPTFWRACFRVLKPGGHLIAFAGTRTVDLMGIALRFAGFEVRDMFGWLYGSGFPKSLDVAKAIDKEAGIWRGRAGDVVSGNGSMSAPNYARTEKGSPATPLAVEWSGWGTALKPAIEPALLCRKPLVGTVAENVTAYGTGALNIDGCRIGTEERHNPSGAHAHGVTPVGPAGHETDGRDAVGRWPANVVASHLPECEEQGTRVVDETVEAWACVEGCPVAELDRQSGVTTSLAGDRRAKSSPNGVVQYGGNAGPQPPRMGHEDTGGASRFFYTAKASTSERENGLDFLPRKLAHELVHQPEGAAGMNSPRAGAGRTSQGRANIHPTVKPIALMRHLVRLVTPPGGVVLDPFAGSGTTGVATVLEGFRFIGVELDTPHAVIAWSRVAVAARSVEGAKRRANMAESGEQASGDTGG